MADESARGFPSSAFSQAGFQLCSMLDLELLTIRERERIRKAPIPVRVDLLMRVYRENLCDVIALDTALSLVDKAIAIEKKPRSLRGRVLPPDIYYSPKHEERAQNTSCHGNPSVANLREDRHNPDHTNGRSPANGTCHQEQQG